MPALRPYPFDALIRRAFRELERRQSIFDLPSRRFVLGDAGFDISVRIHGAEAASPLGPAAGPHTQLAQNIVLSWLCGGRAIELKTVQIKDDLKIPRPCIDMRSVGYNIEWSQELRLEESLEEYVKASMLIEMLAKSGLLPLAPGFARTAFDVSVGYDLAGISSPRVEGFLRGITSAGTIIDRLRRQIPDEYKQFRDLDYRTRVASSVTLSTFHGCPPDEIEQIARLLLHEHRLPCTLKLNPTLLGRDEAMRLLHGALNYLDIEVPDGAFERDAAFDSVVPAIERLSSEAEALGLHVGIKLTNTLLVRNNQSFFPKDQREMYLSGAPLHVLAMHLVRRFRRVFGGRLPISFSGGIDAVNFPDAVALGLAPVSVCTDWLRTGGYARAHRYFDELYKRMGACRAKSRGDFILRYFGNAAAALKKIDVSPEVRAACEAALENGGDLASASGEAYGAWTAEAVVMNTEGYVEAVAQDPRYSAAQAARPPKKIGRHLTLFDCIACDKCVPVCPNDANFVISLPVGEIPKIHVLPSEGGLDLRREGSIAIEERHQIGNFVDLCNECGNCDVFCPQSGGPERAKPRFFGSLESFQQSVDKDGFYMHREAGGEIVLARLSGLEHRMEVRGGRVDYEAPGARLHYREGDLEGSLEGTVTGEIDLTGLQIMDALRRAVLSPVEVNFVSCLS